MVRPPADPPPTSPVGVRGISGPAAILLLVLGTNGCYRYLPLEGPPPVGMEVELMLSEDAEEDLEKGGVTLLRFANTSMGGVAGLVLATSDDSLTVQIASTRAERFGDGMLYQQVSLAFSDVDRIWRRKHNMPATLAVVSAFGGLGLLVVNRLGGPWSENTGR